MIRILSLDDEPELLELYSLIFERSGYDHTSSANRYEAWVLQELGEPALPALRELAAQEIPLAERQWSIAKSAEHAVRVIERNLQSQ